MAYPKRCPGRIGTITRRLVDDAVVAVVRREIAGDRARARIESAIERELTPGLLAATAHRA